MVDPQMFPVYSEVEGKNSLVIGVSHTADVNRSNSEKLKFKGAVRKADHLIFEASLEGLEFGLQGKSSSYEIYAFSLKPQFSHSVEDAADAVNACIQNGMPFYLAHLCDCVGMIVANYQGIVNEATINRTIKEREVLCKGFAGKVADITRANLFKMIPLTILNSGLVRKIDEYLPFSLESRNYLILGPRVSNLIESLQGRKAVIVGDNHREYLKKRISGESLPIPLNWGDYKTTLPADKREAFSLIESIL